MSYTVILNSGIQIKQFFQHRWTCANYFTRLFRYNSVWDVHKEKMLWWNQKENLQYRYRIRFKKIYAQKNKKKDMETEGKQISKKCSERRHYKLHVASWRRFSKYCKTTVLCLLTARVPCWFCISCCLFCVCDRGNCLIWLLTEY